MPATERTFLDVNGPLAVVVADGEVPARAELDGSWPTWATGISLVVAADGGARRLARLGLRADLLVGDFDSLPPDEVERSAAAGVEVRRSPVAKDESDTELAVLAAIARGAGRIIVLGALGGRIDHALANVGLLAHPALGGRPIELLDARSRVVLLGAPGPHGDAVTRALPGPVGALVSLLPLGDGVQGVTTRGLRYPLLDEPLACGPARGLSNVRESATASVTLRRGRLLVIESRPDGARPAEGDPS